MSEKKSTALPGLKIRSIKVPLPVIQGGMGVSVSASALAAAVSRAGGIGTIASVGLGDPRLSPKNYVENSNRALAEEIRLAKANTDGPIAVNVMVALSNYEELVRTAVDAGADMIISGAGLPLSLPKFVGDKDVALAPIVSSARAADMLFRSWSRKYGRIPDAFIVEGPLAGGHLGFSSKEHIGESANCVEKLVAEVVEVTRRYADESSTEPVPVIAAGGVFTRSDVDVMFDAGAAGVQVGTLFVCTEECQVDKAFKEAYVAATEDDVVLFKSPVGMWARAIKTPLLERVLNGEHISFPCKYQCLRTCSGTKAICCIAQALLNARHGNLEEGIVFAGANVDLINAITSVREVMEQLLEPAPAPA